MTFNELKAKVTVMIEDEQEKFDKEFYEHAFEEGTKRVIKKFKLRPTVKVSERVN